MVVQEREQLSQLQKEWEAIQGKVLHVSQISVCGSRKKGGQVRGGVSLPAMGWRKWGGDKYSAEGTRKQEEWA